MMLHDRYGLAVSTASRQALDAYDLGCERLIGLFPDSTQEFERAILADPGFVLPHLAKARAQQLLGHVSTARAAIAAAEQLPGPATEREASQVAFFSRLLSGPAQSALDLALIHLSTWPRDVVVLSTCASTNGLVGFSGKTGREQHLVDFLDGLAGAFGDDWWFGAHHGMALLEVGRHKAARAKIERSMIARPDNAWIAHAQAHLCYETGAPEEAIAYLDGWLAENPSTGLLHGHLGWHLALCELERGNIDGAFRLYDHSFAAALHSGPPAGKLADAVSFLWRAELAGYPSDPSRWRTILEFGRRMFPAPGVAYIDWHVALAEAAVGDGHPLRRRMQVMDEAVLSGSYACGPIVMALSRAFVAFRRREFATAIDQIEPLLNERERVGGSRAQIDLVEFTLLKAYVEAGRSGDSRRLLAARREGAGVPAVAGLAAHAP